MKKFSFLLNTALASAVAVVLFASCQKEQDSNTEETPKPAASENIVAVAGSGSYSGSIKSSYAASLAANYQKKYGDDDDQAQSVAFSAKDLVAFINGLQTKYKSDIIYVNFGVYGKGAAPVNARDYGRLTVYFTGNKMSPGSGIKTNGTDDPTDGFLNHGSIYP